MSASTLALEVRDLRVDLGRRTILDGVDLMVESGTSATLAGPSGSGKSTMLATILGMIRPRRGNITVAGVSMSRASRRTVARLRRTQIGTVFQGSELLGELTPLENVAVAGLLERATAATAFARAQALLDELEVPTDGTLTRDLSGGERQRTAVARALINGPSLILADEPTGALDMQTRTNVADLIFAVSAARGAGLVVVTHDDQIAARGDQRLELCDGRLWSRTT
ncbi:MAG: ABC transporter ATP-binding protein [Cellulomonadaceae bacterium]